MNSTKTPDTYDKGTEGQTKTIQIRIDDVIKIYQTKEIEVVALRGLSCTFYQGEITVIMGPSGCGKTTLLNLIGGFDRPSSGKILVDSTNICKYSDLELEQYRCDHIGFVFQSYNLVPDLTAEENILLPLDFSGNLTPEKIANVHELLSQFEISDRKTHKPDELSGGEQQKISIISAMANNPDILLCDEPTGELDSESKLMIMNTLRFIIKQYPTKSIIIVTHDPEMKTIADRLYLIRDGVISQETSKDELLDFQGQKNDFVLETLPKRLNLTQMRKLNQVLTQTIEKIEKYEHIYMNEEET